MDAYEGLLEQLKGIGDHDGEAAHVVADDILLAALFLLDGKEIVDAYKDLKKRCGGFWYA